jgi:hypothetical protein
MEDLCNQMSGMIPVHDPEHEYQELSFSKSISLVDLSKSVFLVKTFNRYRKYLSYIDFQSKNYHGELVLILINDFLSFENVNYNQLVLAARCVSIDMLLFDLVNREYESDFENLEEPEEYDDY